MRFLHSSDWHLGQKFLSNDRQAEHRLALDWILETIEQQKIDALIVAGDIFDIGSPPNYAREMYYEFLANLKSTCCHHVIIVGGNHDSPAMLQASREILQFLNIYVVGAIDNGLESCVLELKTPSGELEAVVGAVPFLRDRDLREATSGESSLDRIEQIKMGIRNVYRDIAQLLKPYKKQNIPIITTGHLFAAGSDATDKQANIYLGDTLNIQASEFDEIFDYVALGHIHRPQIVGKLEHIRYCGSPIPLSFSEILDEKLVVIIDFSSKNRKIEEIQVPTFRRLKSFSGSLEEVKQRLVDFNVRHIDDPLPVWVEIIIESDKIMPGMEQDLYDWTLDMNLELLKIKLIHPEFENQKEIVSPDLDDLSPIEVFERICLQGGSPPEEFGELKLSFHELESWMKEEEGSAP